MRRRRATCAPPRRLDNEAQPLRFFVVSCALLVGNLACSTPNTVAEHPSAKNSAQGPAAQPPITKDSAAPVERPKVAFQQVAPGVWVHTSWGEVAGVGPFPSNGLVVSGTQGAVIVDTAWGLPSTSELLDWTAREFGSVHAVVVTHWHDDRTSGLPEVHKRGIVSYASSLTLEEAKRHGAPLPLRTLEELGSLAALGVDAETFYPGPGHTVDNIVVWLAGHKVLFGGCLVKAAEATSLGNVVDANILTWPSSLRAVLERYPLAHVVVPGHGAPGGIELLSHTRTLAEAAATKAPQ